MADKRARPFANQPDSRSYERLFWAIIALAAVLRVIKLGTYPFWLDEVHNLIKASHIEDVVLRGEYVSNHPPLFSILASIWRVMEFGPQEWFMRMLPALLGVIAVGAVFWAGETLFNRKVGLFAAFLMAVSPVFVTHSQDFKEYMLLPTTGTVAAVALYKAASTNAVGWWVAYTVAAALACYSESFAGPLLVAINAWYMAQVHQNWRTLPGWVASNVVAFALFAAYLPFLLRRADKMLVESDAWWLGSPTPLTVVFYLKTLAFGYSARDPLFKIALLIFVAALAAGIFFAFKKERRTTIFLLCWFVLPVAIVYGISHVIESIFLFRALLPFGVPAFLLIAVGVDRIGPVAGRVAVAGLFGLIAIPGLWDHYNRNLHPEEFPHRPAIHSPQDFKSVAKTVNEQWQEGDAVVCAAINSWLTVRWYGLDHHPLYFGAIDSGFIADQKKQNVRTSDDPEYDTLLPRMMDEIVPSYGRVWLVFAEWERAYLPGNPMQLWRWLDVRYTELGRWAYEGVELRLYDTSGPSNTIKRASDDGVAAELYRPGDEAPYRHLVPDTGLVAREEHERRGRLRLSLNGDAWEERKRVARGDETRLVTFMLTNNSNQPAMCDVRAIATDGLVATGGLRKREPESGTWRTWSQHRPGGQFANYELPVGVAHIQGPGSVVLDGDVAFGPGVYDTSVFMLGASGDRGRSRGAVSISVGSASVFPFANADDSTEPFSWRWQPGNPVRLPDSPQPLTLTATALDGLPESYVDIAYVSFVRRRELGSRGPGGQSLFLEPWPGTVTLVPAQSRSWTLEVDKDMGRVDVWAWDQGADGMVYRVFETGAR